MSLETRGDVRWRDLPWGSILFAAALTIGCLWYLWDAWSASDSVTNLILVGPVSALAALLGIIVLIEQMREFRHRRSASAEKADTNPSEDENERRLDWRMPAFMALVVAFVATLMPLGFDVSTLLFTGLTLWLLGERSLWRNALFSILFTAVVVGGLKLVLFYHVPTLFG